MCHVSGQDMTSPWGPREWQPTPVFLPGEFHGQRSLAGYSPWDQKELDTTERLSLAGDHRTDPFKLVIQGEDAS